MNDIATIAANLPAEIRERLLADAQDQVATEASSGYSYIRIDKRGFFTLDGNRIGEENGTVLNAIILAAAFENSYYEGKYDPNADDKSPTCTALGYELATLAPPADLQTKQADACAGCEFNEFGSSDKGKGKACKNGRRLALVSVNEADYSKATPLFLRLPPTTATGVKAPFPVYMKSLGRMQLPVYMVKTKITFDQKTEYPKRLFSAEGVITDNAQLSAIIGLRDKVLEPLVEPFRRREDDEEPAPAADSAAEQPSRKVKY